MEKLPVRARITDEITGVIYVVRCARELSPQEIQNAILEHRNKKLSTLLLGRGQKVEIRVAAE